MWWEKRRNFRRTQPPPHFDTPMVGGCEIHHGALKFQGLLEGPRWSDGSHCWRLQGQPAAWVFCVQLFPDLRGVPGSHFYWKGSLPSQSFWSEVETKLETKPFLQGGPVSLSMFVSGRLDFASDSLKSNMEAIKVGWNLDDDSILQKYDFESPSVILAVRCLSCFKRCCWDIALLNWSSWSMRRRKLPRSPCELARVAMLVVTCRLNIKKSSIGQSVTGGTEIQLPALLELWEISVEGLAALACFDPMWSYV